MPIRIFNDDEEGVAPNLVADAILFAVNNGAWVLSNSWTYENTNPNLVPVVVSAISNAVTNGRSGKGCVVVFSPSNTADHFVSNPGQIGFPGSVNIPGVVTVGASNRYDTQAVNSPSGNPSSNNNQVLDVVAPSSRTIPSKARPEKLEVWTLDMPSSVGFNPAFAETLPSSGTNHLAYTGRFGGTSAAAAEIGGLAGLVLSVNPDLTQQQVFDIITSTADKVGGYTYTAGRSNELGFGRANACKAVLEALKINSVVGPGIVCGNTSFSLQYSPQNSGIVSWTSNNPKLTINSSGSVTRVGNFNGNATITATITTDCGNAVLTKNLTVGTPLFQTGSSTICNTRSSSVFFYNTNGVFYTWEVLDSFNDVVDGGFGTSFTVYGGQLGVGNFKVKAGDPSCTPYSNWKQTNIKVVNCGSFAGTTLDAYPNPAVNTLTVTVVDSLDTTLTDIPGQGSVEPYQLFITDKFSNKVVSLKPKTKKTIISTENLAPGIYHLVVRYKEAVLTKQIVIKR